MLGTEGEAAPPMLGEFLKLFDLGDAPQSWYDGVGTVKSGPDKASSRSRIARCTAIVGV